METERDTTGNLLNTEVHSKCFYYYHQCGGEVLGLYAHRIAGRFCSRAGFDGEEAGVTEPVAEVGQPRGRQILPEK